ncbi:suppressor of cytokine signaling 7 isoform X1 [Hemiscyllium ocellatum]|uniref:suppressor of cytokine signaling 7 isoform X1 n=1 Tax=Hemiscyllium ocellatum TaxID=170820 RepID=UPI0029663834|nr:suppressor of cytokine signaling 7 isoform X1 [Hemiscyllium ocellatum]
MNPPAAADLVLLHVLTPTLEEGGGPGPGAIPIPIPGPGSGSAPAPLLKPFPGRGGPLLQDAAAACQLQPFGFPGTKGSRPQLMVFRNLVRPEDGLRGPGSGTGGGRGDCSRGEARSPPGSPGAAGRGGGGCCCRRRREERVCFDLARDFGGFSVAGAGGEWPPLPAWGCSQAAEGVAVTGESSGTRSPSEEEEEEPTETSDALLVLEGIELEAGGGGGGADSGSPGDDPPSPAAPPPPSPGLTEPGSPGALPKVRLSRCSSSPSPSLQRGAEDKLLGRLPGKSRKSSLKIRLSKLFRTKSCSDPAAKRHSVELDTSAGCLVEISQLQEGYTIRSKPRLTRTQSAFTPVSLASPFTGETVSLVDLDISRRGPPSPHPPTPPPPPRRSLSLLDDIVGQQTLSYPVNPAAACLQSLPLPPPPPPHTSIQLSLSLNDTGFLLPLADTLQRNSPQIRPMTVQPPNCLLNRRDSNTFAASLRELEKCGWYWGPMNWDDAEMKLKGKPDGSFLVRDSSDPRYILSLSFRSQGITHHTRMEHYRGTFSLWCHPKFEDRCQSVVEFIERAIMHSKNGKFLYFLRSRVPGLPPTPVQLLYPVSRFSNVKSLQHLCRFRIRQLVRIDHIPELPLPKPLISYLRKFYYYDPEEEAYLSLQEARLRITHEQDMDTQT